ncbi:MAG: cell division protein ZapB [Spirochaetia bacterium]|jgi:FtsZ-binding cell division protein ZapB
MITLEQIRLLESKITRALDLIRLLKEENSTLRKGLESAQKRMRELETLVEGFKTDQKEIESVIVRTLHNLDELEESASAPAGGIPAATKRSEARIGGGAVPPTPPPLHASSEMPPGAAAGMPPGAAAGMPPGAAAGMPPGAAATEDASEPHPPKEELDIF